jgi:serine/threonine-protein kinase HipA
VNAKASFRTFSHIERLSVRLDLYGRTRDVGTLAWGRDERRAYFEYHRDFIAEPLPLSPIELEVSAGAKAAPYAPFDGLHGLFNDSLPDGWGRLLLDRRLEKENYDHRVLNPLDRLAFVGTTGMGALRYLPEKVFDLPKGEAIDLDRLASQAEQVQGEIDAVDIDRLLQLQGGSGGARPKVMIGLNPKTDRVVADNGSGLGKGFEPWIVKFKSSHDTAQIGAEEYAYSLMAKDAEVEMPSTKLMKTSKGNYFAVRRFDRTEKGSAHVQTVSGLLHVDHRAPQIDYNDLLKLTRILTRDERHVRQMFRRMVFNVASRNRDDHSKNHAFRMATDGTWHPTPAYDLTLSDGPAGEHSLAIAGEGRNPSRKHIMTVAKQASIPDGEATAIFEQVQSVVSRWPDYAKTAGVSDGRISEIDRILTHRN